MEENTTIDIAQDGYADFEAAFNGDDGYQTEDTGENAETDSEESAETETETVDDETAQDGESTAEGEETGEDTGESTHEDSFTIRVNKEDWVVTRDEMFSLAQKGADYDRVKGQLAESRQTIQQMQTRLQETQSAMDVLEMIATENKISINELVEQFHVNFRMKNGETEAEAKANIRALKAEKQVSAIQAKETAKNTAQPDSKARAEKEVAEFHNRFPGVELTEALCNELMENVRNGMSLADAYQKRELARKDAEIAELKKQMAADKQNKKNHEKAVGSQNDSGGRRTKSEYDDFMTAFK